MKQENKFSVSEKQTFQKTLFWNVDTQYDFMRQDGALYVPGAETIEGNLEKLTKHAAAHGIKVVSTADWHNESTEEIAFAPAKPDFVMTFPPHCMQDTPGAEYVAATAVSDAYTVDWDAKTLNPKEIAAKREIVIRKDKFDAFAGNPHTDNIVNLLNPERVVVYGVATNYCVNFAVQGLVKRGFDVYVVQDAIKELPLPKENGWNHENVIRQWQESGVKLITTDKLLKQYTK